MKPVRLACLALFLSICLNPTLASACCPAGRADLPVVNADQSVIIIWDSATKTEHFIRQASFKTDSADVGFLIPTPSKPELSESGNEAFGYLDNLTAPKNIGASSPLPVPFACSVVASAGDPSVHVLDDKMVSGFHAQVLQADNSAVLVDWLKQNGYAFSSEIEAWSKPYVGNEWKITALKVVKDGIDKTSHRITASALRLSFHTERPLFPYREPDPTSAAKSLGVHGRLLNIYFIADQRYEGQLTQDTTWTGKTSWSRSLDNTQRTALLERLGLPATTGPDKFWLTKFADFWPYRPAPADLYFSPSPDQTVVASISESSSRDGSAVVVAMLLLGVASPRLIGGIRRRAS